MAKTIKSLLRISMAMRNLGCLTNYTMTKRFMQTTVRCSTNHNKETLVTPRPHLIDDNVTADLPSLEEILKNSRSHEQIFQAVKANQNAMSVNDTVNVLNHLVEMEKVKSIKTKKIYQREEFLILCEILKKNIRKLDIDRTINSLKALIYFEVPTTSIIVQMLLQLIRKSINELSLPQISFLDFLLTKCQNTPLVGALKIAMPIVYENNVITKLERESIHNIKNALSYLAPVSKNTEVFTIIIHALKKCKQPMDSTLAKSILWSLCDMQCYPEGLPEALNHVQNVLAGGITLLDQRTIMRLLEMISERIRKRERYFYHEGFMDACASVVISDDWGFNLAIEVLDKLIIIGHTQISLLDYIAGKCFEDRSLLETYPPASIAILIHGFSVADYKPVFWDAIQEYVMSDRMIEDKTMNYPLSKLAISLLSLDCYCPKLLAKTFEQHARKKSHRYIEKGRALLLYQAIMTLYPQYPGSVPVDVSEMIRPRFTDFPLLTHLENALGGSRYVLTSLSSKLGHFVDHALVMRKGGFPIAINNEPKMESDEYPIMPLEDLKPPQDSQVILVINVPTYAYSTNTQRMKGPWLLQIRTLEALSGYTVIPIRSSMWLSLSESEKIPYLMQAIRLKCDELSISANS